MTTKNIFVESGLASDTDATTPEESDTVVMGSDDVSSSDSNAPVAASVQGEDGIVDVSMRDASQAPEQNMSSEQTGLENLLRPETTIPSQLTKLFTAHVATTGEGVPTGWNTISEGNEYDEIKSRIPKRVAHRPVGKSGTLELVNGDSGSATSEDELADNEHEEMNGDSDNSSSASNTSPTLPDEGSDTDLPDIRTFSKSRNPRSKKAQRHQTRGKHGRNKRAQRRTPPPPPQPLPKTEGAGLVRPGEAIVLDWDNEMWQSLFGGNEGVDEMRGAPTWKLVELFHDEELLARRAQRQSRKKNGITLEDCLNEYGKSETLSEQNAWYCPRCKEHRRAEKMFELWKAPDILVMHLKRFSSNRNFRDKLEVKVDYPIEGLDLTGMVRDHEEGRNLIYDLIAVDNHYGGLGGGHYTAYAKNFVNGAWYEYNGK
jgi:ubiquitin carboxyl-terminal hydrolase 4/11/15